jgi:aspartyl/glutamyl-tRNA(Asn/Gln) amidotransferase C subunit
MIPKEEVEKIAKLARLELSGKEIKKMQKDLSAVLDYFNLLKKIDISSKKVSSFKPQASSSNLRKDEAILQKREVAEQLIASAPDKKDNYIKVKAIL